MRVLRSGIGMGMMGLALLGCGPGDRQEGTGKPPRPVSVFALEETDPSRLVSSFSNGCQAYSGFKCCSGWRSSSRHSLESDGECESAGHLARGGRIV